jgi:hypothetical protein
MSNIKKIEVRNLYLFTPMLKETVFNIYSN